MTNDYREYQKKIFKECLEDAQAISIGVGLPIVYKVALGMFERRCPYYLPLEKSQAGMTTDELAIEGEKK